MKLILLNKNCKRITASFFFLLISVCFAFSQTEKPNIIYILSDDQSWTDYGFMGHPHIETPRIDQLAEEGLTFTRGYVTAPLCSPSLASIITGLYPYQHGITGNDPEFTFEKPRYQTDWQEARSRLYRDYLDEFKTPYGSPVITKARLCILSVRKMVGWPLERRRIYRWHDAWRSHKGRSTWG